MIGFILMAADGTNLTRVEGTESLSQALKWASSPMFLSESQTCFMVWRYTGVPGLNESFGVVRIFRDGPTIVESHYYVTGPDAMKARGERYESEKPQEVWDFISEEFYSFRHTDSDDEFEYMFEMITGDLARAWNPFQFD